MAPHLAELTDIAVLDRISRFEKAPRSTERQRVRLSVFNGSVTAAGVANLAYRSFSSQILTPWTAAGNAPRLAPRVRYNTPRVWQAI